MGQAAVEVEGLKEFRKELRRLADGKTWTKELAREHRELAKTAAGWARAEASSMGGPFAHFARSIKGRGGAAGARISIDSTANATFWGAKKRTGWNAGNDGRAQHPRWVGNSWDVADAGQGPYAINSALASHLNQILDLYEQGIDRVTRSAFPD